MIWDACDGPAQVGPLQGLLYRLVESQQQVATLSYVDTLEEQAVLEGLLEASKPPLPAEAERLHYLLKTPFRYPPLPWGSRFGRRHERGIFYAGGNEQTTLAESAFYRLVFLASIDADPISDGIHSEHTLFSASYASDLGVRLQEPPFNGWEDTLAHPASYADTQALGSTMRDSGVEVFEYRSARDADGGHCVGLFSPLALRSKKPRSTQRWLCETKPDAVAFKPFNEARVVTFPTAGFLVDGRLPRPA